MYRKLDISATHDANQVNLPDEKQFEGVVFSDGKVAIRWLTKCRSVAVWDSMDDMLAIHGHPEYGSVLAWENEPPEDLVLALILLLEECDLDKDLTFEDIAKKILTVTNAGVKNET